MTKPISTVAALILVDRGIISLDDPIDKFLPEYKDILIVRGADHAMSYKVGKEEYEGKVGEFIERFI